MSEQSPYELLGVTEGASFDEIQTARDRLVDGLEEAGTKVEQIEAAYDAVLMHRLRLRQEGKIKVPERIRFPERSTPAPKTQEKSVAEMGNRLPGWMQDLADQPSAMDILLPALVTLVLMGIAVLYLQPSSTASGDGALELVLAGGVASSLYFLNRKEGKFGRSFFITIASMFAGLIVGSLIAIPLESVLAQPQPVSDMMTAATLSVKQFIVVISLGVLWLSSSFMR